MARQAAPRNRDDLLAVVVAVVVIVTLYFAKVILIPLALAILFTFILTPLVKFLERARLGRIPSTLIVVLLSVAGIGAIGWAVTKQFAGVMEDLPNYKANITKKIESVRWAQSEALGNASNTMNELGRELSAPPTSKEAAEAAESQPKTLGGSKRPTQAHPLAVEVVQPSVLPLESVQGLLGLLASTGIVFVFTTFMIIRREDLRNRFISLAGQGRLNLMTQALDDAGDRVSRYLRLQSVVNASYGLVIGLGLHFIGVPGALLWGVIVGILRFIPYLGPPLGAIMPFLLSLAIFDGWTRPLITLALFAVTELMVSNLVEPLLYGEHTGLSSVAILVAAVFWTALWGPIGLVLSTPLTVCLVVCGRHAPRLGFLHVLLGDEPVLTPESRFYQRLLAMDHDEAKDVLEEYLKDKPLEELYDFVIIPALSLAEQDRHRNNLEEVTAKFICQSTKELVEELGAKYDRETARQTALEDKSDGSKPELSREAFVPVRPAKIICVPARDEADEIVGIMLAQVLERAGYNAQAVSIGPTPEMLVEVSQAKPDIVCVSALPPFAITHARALYGKVRAQSAGVPIVIGLWNFTGDKKAAAIRLGIAEDRKVLTSISGVVQEVSISMGLACAMPVQNPALPDADGLKGSSSAQEAISEVIDADPEELSYSALETMPADEVHGSDGDD